MKNRVEAFLQALKQEDHAVEAVTVYQNGEILLNHRFIPHCSRQIYSHTKSFVATAAGMAIDEGKLQLDSRFMDFFPDYAPMVTDKRVFDITLRDLLTMSSGFGDSFLMSATRRKGEGFPDYVAYMVQKALANDPGSTFLYSNADTHLAGCMVEKAVGEPLIVYMYRKLFAKLDMGYPAWEATPTGGVFGGSGMYLPIEDMIKLGILYLHDGVWNGERLLSHEWVEMVSCKQIDTGNPDPWYNGYSFQFWLIGQQPGAFRCDGLYGQYSLILPKENAVVAIQSSEQNDVLKIIPLMIKYLIS
jgi:CubicO group peptidase (beta-lactamase class C family)